MKNQGKIFVPYSQYYDYLDHNTWGSTYRNRLYYSGSKGLVYDGLNASNAAASGSDISRYRVGKGTNSAGNGYTTAFEGQTLLGIPKYYDNGDLPVTVIGTHAFSMNTDIQRVSIPDSVEIIQDYAFYGCKGIKFVLMTRTTPPEIGMNTFEENSADRIFVVPDSVGNTVRTAYTSAPNWQNYAHLIITQSEYEKMSTGSGFTHFDIKKTTSGEFEVTINVQKYDDSIMTVIWGDGTSQVCGGVADDGSPIVGESLTHIYNPGEYTISFIARGPWNLNNGAFLLGTVAKNAYLINAHFDEYFAAYDRGTSQAKPESTISDTAIFMGAINLESLSLPKGIVKLPENLLSGLYSLVSLQLPFVGLHIDPNTVAEALFGRIFSTNQYGTGAKTAIVVNQKYGDDDGEVHSFYMPAGLRNVTILSGEIGAGAFSGCEQLESIIITEDITTYGAYAFYGCTNLKNFDIPETVTTIGAHCFDGCNNWEATRIPSGLTAIPDYAFNECNKISLSTLPSGLTAIGSHGFNNCTAIKLASLPATLASLGDACFKGCANITLSELPETLTTLPAECFSGCTKVTFSELPSGMTDIPDGVYEGCTLVTFSNFIDGTTKIGANAFKNCANVEFTELPSTLTEIGANAFYECKKVSFDSLPNGITSIGEYTFYSCLNVTFSLFPPNIQAINAGTFKSCVNVTFSAFPENIVRIGESAFEGCYNVRFAALPNTVTEIGAKAFMNCTAMRMATISNRLVTIPDHAFDTCTNMTLSYIPASVTSIGKRAFAGCVGIVGSLSFGSAANGTGLSGVAGNTSIAVDAFEDCGASSILNFRFYSGLSNAYVPSNGYEDGWGALQYSIQKLMAYEPTKGRDYDTYFTFDEVDLGEGQIGFKLVDYSNLIKNKSLQPPEIFMFGPTYINSTGTEGHIVAIGPDVFNMDENADAQYFFSHCEDMSFTDGCSIDEFEEGCFKGNTVISDFRLPDSLKIIGRSCFEGCSNLSISELPSGIKEIGERAFYNCDKVNFSVIPASIESIAAGAFDECSNVSALYLDSCNSLQELDISSSDHIQEVSLPIHGYNLKTFRTRNDEYTLLCRFRHTGASGMYMVLNASPSNHTNGFKIFISENVLYAGNCVLTRNVQPNVEYTIIIRGTADDGIVANSLILIEDRVEFNRYDFGYKHSTGYGLDSFNVDEAGVVLTKLEYYNKTYKYYDAVSYPSGAALTNDEVLQAHLNTKLGYSQDGTGIRLFLLPPRWKYETYRIRLDLDTENVTRTAYNMDDRLCNLTWYELAALGREGYLDTSDCTSSTPYNAKLSLDIDRGEGVVTEKWIQVGECKHTKLEYPTGSSYSNCNGGAEVTEGTGLPNMWWELVGLFTDKSEDMGVCPMTFGMKDLLPEKSQLYSASHGMKDMYVGLADYGEATNNLASYTHPTGADADILWLVANGTTCISSIKVTRGATVTGFNFNSSSTTNYVNLPVNTQYGGKIAKRKYNGTVNDSLVTGYFDGNETPDPSTALYFDATLGEIVRDEASECLCLTRGARIGIPVSAGNTVDISYYNSWNLTGWRDCIARTNGNGAHFNALPDEVKKVSETVLKYTNIGGLHKVINETKDKMFLYSLSEAGMYNATDPYMYEGDAYQFYQPSVASNGGRTAVRKKFLINDSPNYTYWWLRTPDEFTKDGTAWYETIIQPVGYGSYGFGINWAKPGVCFGLSTKQRNQARYFNAALALKSRGEVEVFPAMACSPKIGITHIYDFRVKDLDSAVDVGGIFDMRFSLDSGNGLTGGYNISNGSQGIFVGGQVVIAPANINDGDRISLIITQDTTGSATIRGYVNGKLKSTTTLDNITANARAYSSDNRRAVFGNSNTVIEGYEFYNKVLTNEELTKLHSCRYLDKFA